MDKRELNVFVRNIKTTENEIMIDLETTTAAFLRLSYSYYPWYEITVDNKKVRFWKSAMNMLAIRIGEGKHTIRIKAKPSPLRRHLFYLVSATLLAMGLLLMFDSHKDTLEDRS